MNGSLYWGARIRTWDHGTKARCLTAWPRPTGLPVYEAPGYPRLRSPSSRISSTSSSDDRDQEHEEERHGDRDDDEREQALRERHDPGALAQRPGGSWRPAKK